ncbi:MAG: hypothetical protein FWD61_00345 [Phycisphaerales bacterium]|nr:hypothetical protein [Phycisphaerales bacterium]
MPSLVICIADAVVAAIKAEPLKLDAVRAYRPEFELPELKTLRVSVVPRGIEITSSGRNANQHDVSIDVAVQKKVDAGDQEELDGLMTVVEKIADCLRLRRLEFSGGSGGAAVWVKTENAPIYSPEHLESKQVFTSVLTLTFRTVR